MNYFIALLFSVSFTFVFRNYIKKSKTIVYSVTLLLSIFFCFSQNLNINNSVYNYIHTQFTSGTLTTAFFTIVMFIGVFKKNSKLKKALLPIRTQLSFIASFILIPHIWSLFKICYNDFISFNFDHSFLSASISLILILIFIVLFITSYKYFKIKLKAKKWKKIQKFSYPFFFLIFIHIILIKIPYIKLGYYSAIIDLSIYSIMFYLYFLLKFNKYNVENKKYNKNKAILIRIFITIIFIIFPCFVSIKNINNSIEIDNIEIIEEVEILPLEDTAPVEINEQLESQAITHNKVNNKQNGKENPTSMQEKIENPSLVDDEQNINESIELIPLEVNNQDNLITEIEEVSIPVEAIIETQSAIYTDGIYSGSGSGYRDDIVLDVTISEDKITKIKVKYNVDDARFFDKAFATLKKEILNIQSSDVDTICCATYSSRGIINAVEEALDQAKIK